MNISFIFMYLEEKHRMQDSYLKYTRWLWSCWRDLMYTNNFLELCSNAEPHVALCGLFLSMSLSGFLYWICNWGHYCDNDNGLMLNEDLNLSFILFKVSLLLPSSSKFQIYWFIGYWLSGNEFVVSYRLLPIRSSLSIYQFSRYLFCYVQLC